MPALPSPPQVRPPAQLPADCAEKFRVVKLLASGGFGAVFQAEQLALERAVAVKVLLADALEDADQAGRFADEARMTAALQHPHVVRVLDHGAATGVPWIAYELLSGRTLRGALDQRRLAPGAAIAAAREIAAALDAAHERGIVHRDIKPENVLEDASGHYKVADFGIGRWGSQRAVRTQTGVVLGTPAYLAPEVILGGEPRPAADIYSLGVLLHELLTGERPFTDENPMLLLQCHIKSPPPPLRSAEPSLPAALESLVLRLLDKSPDHRPSARALHDELEPFLALTGDAPARAAAAGTATVRNRGARPLTTAPSLPPAPAPSPNRARPLLLLAPAALILLLLLLRPPSSSPTSTSSPSSSPTPSPSPSPSPSLSPADLLAEFNALSSVLQDLRKEIRQARPQVVGFVLENSGPVNLGELKRASPATFRRLVERRSAVVAMAEQILSDTLATPLTSRGLMRLLVARDALKDLVETSSAGALARLDTAARRRRTPPDWVACYYFASLAFEHGRYDASLDHLEAALADFGDPAARHAAEGPVCWEAWVHILLLRVRLAERMQRPEDRKAAALLVVRRLPADLAATLDPLRKVVTDFKREYPGK